MKKQILLVEDDESMGFLLKDSLENYGFGVTHVSNGKAAWEEFQAYTFDLCLLDVMMPIMDGFSLAKEIRKVNTDVPLIFLTAKTMKEDRLNGFKIGADDYVTKPFSVEELVYRMKAIFKRGHKVNLLKESVVFLDYSLDLNNLLLVSSRDKKQLTQKEMDLLALFVTHKNTLLRREVILNDVWEDDNYFVGRSLDVFISRLRKFFVNDQRIKIVNIHGSGYKFQIQGDKE